MSCREGGGSTIALYVLLCCREEFREHGLNELVTIQCRDVCQDGFGLESIADAGTDSRYRHYPLPPCSSVP